MKLRNLTMIAAGAAAASHHIATASASVSPQKPNILFILVDDLGLGDLSCQWAKDMHTPNIDSLFTSGVRLDNFHANSNVSSPSRAALLTGRFPAMVGVPGVIRTRPDQNWGYFDPSARTMPQILGQAGYNTALIGKWHLGLETPNLPTERGFGFFHGFLGDMMDDYYSHLREGNNYMRLNDKTIDPKGHATELFTAWSVDYLESQSGSQRPFFLYLAYNAPHSPLQPPVEWFDKVKERHPGMPLKRQRLIALIEHLDHNVGLVIAALRKTGQAGNTLVVFTSDNGGDRGSMANNGDARGAKGDMFEGGIKVPCALNMPGVFEGGRRVDNFVMMMDLLPTICDLVGIKAGRTDGMSVLDAVNGKQQNTDGRFVYWLRYEGGSDFAYGAKPQTAVRYGDCKLLRNLPGNEPMMFDMAADSREQTPLPLQGHTFRKLDRAMQRHYELSKSVPNQPPAK